MARERSAERQRASLVLPHDPTLPRTHTMTVASVFKIHSLLGLETQTSLSYNRVPRTAELWAADEEDSEDDEDDEDVDDDDDEEGDDEEEGEGELTSANA